MGPFSAAMDLLSLANKLTGNDEDVNKTISLLNNTKSITERAKKALFVYPVLFTPGVSDIKIATKISKFLEIQYALFTTMTVGMTPSVDDGNIANYLNSISAEGYDYTDKIKLRTYNVDKNHTELWFDEFKRSNENFFEEYESREDSNSFSFEDLKAAQDAYDKVINDLDSLEKAFNDKDTSAMDTASDNYRNDLDKYLNEVSALDARNKLVLDNSSATVSSLLKREKEISEKIQKSDSKEAKKLRSELDKIKEENKSRFNNLNPFDISEDDGLEGRASTDSFKTIDKLKTGNPTVFNLKVKIKGYEQDFVVPIAIKTNPHFVTQNDLAALFDSAIEDKRLLTRLVKLSSGEISFFKDFLFAMDRAKRDQELYAKFGQHPWYRQFIERKENNKIKKLGIIASVLSGHLKGIVNATSNFLPTASIVMTLDECERSTKMKYGFLLKHEKILWDVLNHLGLLCICIYNPELETCSFYFNGFKKPMLVALSDMKGDNSDANAEMAKVMQLMMKRGIA